MGKVNKDERQEITDEGDDKHSITNNVELQKITQSGCIENKY